MFLHALGEKVSPSGKSFILWLAGWLAGWIVAGC